MAKIRLSTASAKPKGQHSSGTATAAPPVTSNQDDWDDLFGGSDDDPANDPLATEQADGNAIAAMPSATPDPLAGIDAMDVTAFFGGDLPSPGEVSSATAAEPSVPTTEGVSQDPYDFSDLDLPDGATDATEEFGGELGSDGTVAEAEGPADAEQPRLVTCHNCGTKQVDLGVDYVCAVCRVGRLPSYDYPAGHPFHPDTAIGATVTAEATTASQPLAEESAAVAPVSDSGKTVAMVTAWRDTEDGQIEVKTKDLKVLDIVNEEALEHTPINPAAEGNPLDPPAGDSAEGSSPEPPSTDPKLLECLREIQEARDEVRDRETALQDLEDELGTLKESVKEAKVELRSAQRRLEAVIDRYGPLVDAGDVSDGHSSQNPASGDDGIPNAIAFPAAGPFPKKPVDKDGWKPLPTSELAKHGLPISTCSMLTKRGYETLGSLSVKGDRDGYRSIKGVSETKEEWIINAFIEFWKAHPEYVEETQPAAPGKPAQASSDSEPVAESATDPAAEDAAANPTGPEDTDNGSLAPWEPEAAESDKPQEASSQEVSL